MHRLEALLKHIRDQYLLLALYMIEGCTEEKSGEAVRWLVEQVGSESTLAGAWRMFCEREPDDTHIPCRPGSGISRHGGVRPAGS